MLREKKLKSLIDLKNKQVNLIEQVIMITGYFLRTKKILKKQIKLSIIFES